MDNFADERDFKILEADKYTFFILARILKRDCELLLTDHSRMIICYSQSPFPVWIWTADDATISNVVVEDNTLKSFNLRFDVPDNLGETTSWVGIQSEMFNEGDPDNSVYGDLTDSGTVYNKLCSTL